MSKIRVIGLQGENIPEARRPLLASADLIVGGKRHLSMVTGCNARQIPITPLATAFAAISESLEREGTVVVLASGDPLFFGIAKTLYGKFPSKEIAVHPAVSSLQLACARIGMVWDDAHIISLHGRELTAPGTLLQNQKCLLLTDHKNSPDILARALLDYLALIEATEFAEKIRIHVCQDLELASEEIFSGSLQEAAGRNFSPLNVTCLEIAYAAQSPETEGCSELGPRFGLTETDICHSRGLITKSEVRAATLHSLRLPRKGVFWDVGGGSGSISIEAARLNPDLAVFTIERQPEELDNIKRNIRNFGCYNITPVAGSAPDALTNLPEPDAVFIGGSGGNLEEIISHVAQKLQPAGRCVVNGVIAKTVAAAPDALRRNGFSVQMTEIRVQRTDGEGKVTPFNPITIITGTR